MKLLSDAAEYGLRAVVWLARQGGDSRTTVQIAEGTKSTFGYLARVMQLLGQAGIVRGKRGKAGGYVLARDPAELTVFDVISAVDPLERIVKCPLGLPEHADGLCALHARIDAAIEQIEFGFRDVTIAEIVSESPGNVPICDVTIQRSD